MPDTRAWRQSAIRMCHSVGRSRPVIFTSRRLLRRALEWLASRGIEVTPLTRILIRAGAGALTVDDRFLSFAGTARPLPRRYGLSTSVFVSGRWAVDVTGPLWKDGSPRFAAHRYLLFPRRLPVAARLPSPPRSRGQPGGIRRKRSAGTITPS